MSFYCPICGCEMRPKSDNPESKKKCNYCKSEVIPANSEHDYDYYRGESMKIYGDYFHWEDVFIEEISKNPQFNEEKRRNAEELRKTYYHYYCPLCGKLQNHTNTNSVNVCKNCGKSIILKKSKYHNEYYRNKAMALYGDYYRWIDVFYNEDLSQNPEFDAKQYTDPFMMSSPKPNIPKCPTCGSTKIKKISATSKVFGAAMFGLFSRTARSQFCCEDCGYKW